MAKETGKIRKTAKVNRDAVHLNTILIENFVNLQRTMTNLTIKFDRLSDQISSLLQLFEISARSFSDKLEKASPEIEKDREFLDKLDRLLDQNKVIAKGLTLMEEKLRERVYGHLAQPMQPTRQAPVFKKPKSLQQMQQEGYSPSPNQPRTKEI